VLIIMNIHEYQSKMILGRLGLPVPRGEVADSPEAARTAAERLAAEGVPAFVVKAQIHAGGRGKAGGIRRADTPEAVEAVARSLLGRPLVTPQTGPEGKLVRRVLVEEAVSIAAEYYVAVLVDRSLQKPIVLASPAGGVDIEEVAARQPEVIFREVLWDLDRVHPYQARRLGLRMGLRGSRLAEFGRIVQGLVEAFWRYDAMLVEVNPLVALPDDRLLLLDAKVVLDDNALYRHPDLAALRDVEEEDPLEVEAARARLSYIRLDGNIGCMVNGAGLAMATMDIIQWAGGRPANFLDVGGGASPEQVAQAFRILMADPRVKAVLINIFGGILRCDRLATGIVTAAREVGVRVPMVIRLEGTNVEEGRRILAESGLNFRVAHDMEEAARKVVEMAREGGS
jgi:succinyl-CoA synthetase beta subunit